MLLFYSQELIKCDSLSRGARMFTEHTKLKETLASGISYYSYCGWQRPVQLSFSRIVNSLHACLVSLAMIIETRAKFFYLETKSYIGLTG